MADKIIYWKKEVHKVTAPLERKLNKLFKDHKDEVSKLYKDGNYISSNELWNKKYKKKYDVLDKKLDAAYKKLWLKYHTALNSTTVKKGYILK